MPPSASSLWRLFLETKKNQARQIKNYAYSKFPSASTTTQGRMFILKNLTNLVWGDTQEFVQVNGTFYEQSSTGWRCV